MFDKKIYKCKCHVCGNEFDLESEFISTGAVILGSDGKDRLQLSCNAFSAGKHTAREIRIAYWGSEEAYLAQKT